MIELSSLDVHFLVRELQELVGGRFQKAYGIDDEIYIQIHAQGKYLLRVHLPNLIYLTTHRPGFPKNPPGFVMFLRKYLANAKLVSVQQQGMDRIIVFTFERTIYKDDEPIVLTYRLVVELMAPGNVVLIGKKPIKGGWSEEIILNLVRPQNFKDRTLRGGIPYEAPPSPIDLKSAGEEELVQALRESTMDNLVKALAISLSMGGTYAELVCKRAGLDKHLENFSEEQALLAIREIKKLLDDSPNPILQDNKLILFPEDAGVSYDSVNAALDEKNPHEKVEQKPKKKKLSILEQQENQKKGFEDAAKINQRRGEVIYEHYQDIKEMMAKIKKGEAVEHPLIRDYDKKTGKLTLQFEE